MEMTGRLSFFVPPLTVARDKNNTGMEMARIGLAGVAVVKDSA